MELFLPGLVPKESLDSQFQLILPLKWKNEKYKPICIHLAGTGDHVRIHTHIISSSLHLCSFHIFKFGKFNFSVLLAKTSLFGKAIVA